jgi:hypothetical protein
LVLHSFAEGRFWTLAAIVMGACHHVRPCSTSLDYSTPGPDRQPTDTRQAAALCATACTLLLQT